MKTYAHILFLVLFSFIFNVSLVGAANCGPGEVFNSSTGKLCSTSSTVSLSANLAIGSRGSDVKAIQQILKNEGYYLGTIDGNYGKRTARALKEFQDDNDLPVTGIVDAATRAVLNTFGTIPTTTTTTVHPASSNIQITNPSTLHNAKMGEYYTEVLGISGVNFPVGYGTNTIDWSVGTPLPPGLYLTASDHGEIITGTPTQAGTYDFYISAGTTSLSKSHPKISPSGTKKNFTLTVNPAPATPIVSSDTSSGGSFTILDSKFPDGTVGQSYSKDIGYRYSYSPNFDFTKEPYATTSGTYGNLPPGFDTSGSGVTILVQFTTSGRLLITGIPAQAGTFSPRITLKDNKGTSQTFSIPITIKPAVTSTNTPTGTTGPNGTLTIMTPNGGETLLIGTTYRIKWVETGTHVRANIYLVDSLGNLEMINSNVLDVGYYDWVVNKFKPSVGEATQYKIQVMVDSSIQDISDNYFTIPGSVFGTTNGSTLNPYNITPTLNPTPAPVSTPTPSPTPTPAPNTDIGLVNPGSITVTATAGQYTNAFTLRSTTARTFNFYGYPTSYGPGINIAEASGGISPGGQQSIRLQVSNSVPAGTYAGTVHLRTSDPGIAGEITFPIIVNIR